LDLATAQANLSAAETAYTNALSEGAGMSIDGRARQWETVKQYREEMEYWQRVIDDLTAAAQGARSKIKVARWTR